MKDLRYIAAQAESMISHLNELCKLVGPEGSSKDADGNEPESLQELRQLVERTLADWKACAAVDALWKDGERFPPNEEQPEPDFIGAFDSGYEDTSELASEGLPKLSKRR